MRPILTNNRLLAEINRQKLLNINDIIYDELWTSYP